MKAFRSIVALALLTALFLLSACAKQEEAQPAIAADSGHLDISFQYNEQSGTASNQFAVWIEDADGHFVRTLYATSFTAKRGYKEREGVLPNWVAVSGIEAIKRADLDAISGATPKPGVLNYVWDLKDANGETVAPGEYRFFVEGSLRWKNRVLYSGAFTVGDEASTVEASAEFTYEAWDDEPALTDDAEENGMIKLVTAKFVPATQ